MRKASKLAVSGFLLCVSAAASAGEGRIPVHAPGTLINSSGKYVLTRNLSGNGAPVIQINTQNVDLDLNGFYVDGAGGVGIQVIAANEVRVHGGVLQNVSVGVEFTSNVFRAVVEDLRIFVPSSDGIRLQANDFAVRRVQINGAGGDGIELNSGTPVTGRVESCHIAGGVGRGIYVLNGNSVALANNVVSNMDGEGINLDGCIGCVVKENTVTQSGGQGGIYVHFALGTTLKGNVVARNRFHGIHLAAAAGDVLVEGNVMKENGSVATPGDGLRVAGRGGMIVGNVMNANFGMGLHFTSSAAFATYGRNTARQNAGLVGNTCTGSPALFFPNSCNESNLDLATFGDNLIPGPTLF